MIFIAKFEANASISQISPKKVAKVSDALNVGDAVKVNLIGIDDRGKVKLSMRDVDQVTGEDISRRDSGQPEAVEQAS